MSEVKRDRQLHVCDDEPKYIHVVSKVFTVSLSLSPPPSLPPSDFGSLYRWYSSSTPFVTLLWLPWIPWTPLISCFVSFGLWSRWSHTVSRTLVPNCPLGKSCKLEMLYSVYFSRGIIICGFRGWLPFAKLTRIGRVLRKFDLQIISVIQL